MIENHEIADLSIYVKSSNLDIVDDDLLEAVGKEELCLLVGAVTNVGHQVHALETPPHAVINTFRLPPVRLRESVC